MFHLYNEQFGISVTNKKHVCKGLKKDVYGKISKIGVYFQFSPPFLLLLPFSFYFMQTHMRMHKCVVKN